MLSTLTKGNWRYWLCVCLYVCVRACMCVLLDCLQLARYFLNISCTINEVMMPTQPILNNTNNTENIQTTTKTNALTQKCGKGYASFESWYSKQSNISTEYSKKWHSQKVDSIFLSTWKFDKWIWMQPINTLPSFGCDQELLRLVWGWMTATPISVAELYTYDLCCC